MLRAQRSVRERIFALALAACAISSCASSPARDKAVLIDEPDAKSRMALQVAVSRTLGVAYVVLADDALTKDNVLTIEPARIRDFQGRRIQGRETRPVEAFHLVRGEKKKECVLIYDRTGARMLLADTRCKSK